MDEKEVKLTLKITGNGTLGLPHCDKIHGAALWPNEVPDLSEVGFQYSSSHTQQWCELRMPVSQARYLLDILSTMRGDGVI